MCPLRTRGLKSEVLVQGFFWNHAISSLNKLALRYLNIFARAKDATGLFQIMVLNKKLSNTFPSKKPDELSLTFIRYEISLLFGALCIVCWQCARMLVKISRHIMQGHWQSPMIKVDVISGIVLKGILAFECLVAHVVPEICIYFKRIIC